MNMINENMRTLVYDVLKSAEVKVYGGASRTAVLVETADEIVRLYDIVITAYAQGIQDRIDGDWRAALSALDQTKVRDRAQQLINELRAADAAR